MINKILDDVICVGSAGDGTVGKFYDTYRQIAEELGVRLADESDKDKAFRSSNEGKVFGISYDLQRWVWWISEDKLLPILSALQEVVGCDRIENGQIMSINGKLNHYMWLVPEGPWQRGFLLRLQDSTKPSGSKMTVGPFAKEQAAWWIVNLRAAAEESKILDPRPMETMCPVYVFSDAAGGDIGKIKNGIGGFIPPSNWMYMNWPSLIKENRENSLGIKFAHKLCSLEGFAALATLATVPNMARNREVIVLCDNAAFVGVFRKKHSKCEYAYTVAKALHDVGVGLGAIVKVKKTKRCYSPSEIAADSLSKGDWDTAWQNMPMKREDPGKIPRAALRWISNPVPDMNLGHKILADMSKYTNVLLRDQ